MHFVNVTKNTIRTKTELLTAFSRFTSFFWLHIFNVAPSNFSNAYSMLYAPYLVFGSQIRRKEMQKGQVGYGIALQRFGGLRVNVLQPSGAKRFNILLSRTVILLVPVILSSGVGEYGLITRIKSCKCYV
jgi:hypothetical protein